MSKFCKLVLVLLIPLLLTTAGYSQTIYATITGTVTDPSGAVLPKATITATNIGTNFVQTTSANDAGNYTLPQLAEGTYTVRVEATGFKEFVVQNLRLAPKQIARLDVALQIGTNSTRVEVSGGDLPQLETETTRVTDLKTADTINKLPLNARWLWDFFDQVPGMSSGPDGYRFMGSTGNLVNFSIDGTTMGDGKSGQIGPLLNYAEQYEAFRTDINNSAEFAGAGNVETITKSGSNQVHGSAYDQYWVTGLNARNYFAAQANPADFHLFGGGLGGPVYLPKIYNGRNKTFFYVAFERSYGNANTFNETPGVPLESWRNGDFSRLLPDTVIYDPTTKQPFPGNKIPAERINPVSQKIQERFYPLPNTGDPNVFAGANYRKLVTSPWSAPWVFTNRFDHHFSEKDFVFGRYNITGSPVQWFQEMSTIGFSKGYRATRSATASYTHVFSPTVVNEARWGMNYNNYPIQGPVRGQEELQRLGLVGLAPNLPDAPGMLLVNWSGIALHSLYQWAGGGPPGYLNHNEEFQDYLSIFRGRHNLKVGVDVTRAFYDDLPTPDNLFGSVTFSSQFTNGGIEGQGHPYADFLLGIPTSSSRAFPGLRTTEKRWQYAGFVNDTFRVNPKLTLTLGLRYQLHTPWLETNNRAAVFDIKAGAIVVPDKGLSQISPLFPNNYVKVVGASTVGLPQTLVRADRNDFAPRIGLAWLPVGPRTVFRASYNIFYDLIPNDYLPPGGSPFQLSEFPHNNPVDNPDVILPRVFPDRSAETVYNSVGLPIAVNPNLRTPMTQMYSFSVDREIWQTTFGVRYTGTSQRYGLYRYNYNSPVPDARPYAEKPRPFPQYPDIMYRTNGAGHQYHGLMTTVKRNLSAGSMMTFAWTWATDQNDLEQVAAWGAVPLDVPENSFNRGAEVGRSQFTPTHRVVGNGYYELPFGKGHRLAGNAGRLTNLLIGGWMLSSTLGYNSGQFLTPLWSGPDPTGTAYTDSTTPAWVTRRPDQIRDPNLPASERTVDRWFDTSAFTAPKPGQFGNATKGGIHGPATLMWNAGFGKQFQFNERGPKFLVQLQMKNVTNRRNWINPDMNVSNVGGAGHIWWDNGISDAAGPRAGSLVFRIEW